MNDKYTNFHFIDCSRRFVVKSCNKFGFGKRAAVITFWMRLFFSIELDQKGRYTVDAKNIGELESQLKECPKFVLFEKSTSVLHFFIYETFVKCLTHSMLHFCGINSRMIWSKICVNMQTIWSFKRNARTVIMETVASIVYTRYKVDYHRLVIRKKGWNWQ